MNTIRNLQLIAITGMLLASSVLAQRQIPWQSTDASGAEQSSHVMLSLYTSTGQPIVGVSTGGGRILHSGYLFVHLMPSGAANLVTQSSVAFGNVIVGQAGSQQLIISNNGTSPLVISALSISPSVFTFSSGSLPITVPSGGYTVVLLSFMPLAAQTYSGTLEIQSNSAGGTPYYVALTGSGISSAPNMQLSASILNFGLVNLGAAQRSSVTISNLGTAALVISGQNLSGTADYRRTHAAAATIPPNGSDYIEIEFAPTVIGQRLAQLEIVSNDPNNPAAVIQLSGEGTSGTTVPRIVLNTTSIDFLTTTVGVPVQRTLEIRNTGTATLNITSQGIMSGQQQFAVITPAAPAIAPNLNSTVLLEFHPATVGTFSGSFKIECNDPSTPQVSVSLRGECIESHTGPRISVNSILDFDSVVVCTVLTRELLIRNIGISDLLILQQSIAGADAFDFSIQQAAASPIEPNNSSVARIAHRPMTAGTKIARFVIQSNDPGASTTEVVLTSVAYNLVGVERLASLPSGIVLHQNYPNPFGRADAGDRATTIVYEIDRDTEVALDVFNIYGQRVDRLVSGHQQRGTYRLIFYGRDLPSGMYLCRLYAAGQLHTRTMVLLR